MRVRASFRLGLGLGLGNFEFWVRGVVVLAAHLSTLAGGVETVQARERIEKASDAKPRDLSGLVE